MCNMLVGESDADNPWCGGKMHSVDVHRSCPRAGKVSSYSVPETVLSHCSLPAQKNFSDGVSEVGDLSVTALYLSTPH